MSDYKILIVEEEPDLLEFIALFLSNEFHVELIKLSSPLAAVEKINELKEQISIIISDYNIPQLGGKNLFDIARLVNPGVRFIIMAKEPRENLQQVLANQATRYLSKPFTEQQINGMVRELLNVVEAKNVEYVPISIESLLLLKNVSKILFKKKDDQYILAIDPTKYEVEFGEISYENYKNNGITHLYVKKEDFYGLIDDFKEKTLADMLYNKINKINPESVKVSTSVVGLLNNTVKSFGFDDYTEKLIKKNMEIVKCLSDSTPEINNLFKWNDAAEKNYAAHHSVLISCLTTAFCREHKFKHKMAGEILAMAAFFHDVTLDELVIKNEQRFIKAMKSDSGLNKDFIDSVKMHPAAGYDWLTGWPPCPLELRRIVLRHHELPNGEGFPRGAKAEEIDELTACFIISEVIVELYLNKKAKGLVLRHFQDLAPVYNLGPLKPFYQIATGWLSNKNISL